MSLLVEYVDKALTDDLTFLLRLTNTCQLTIELIFRVHANHVQAQMLIISQYVLKLVLAQQAMIHENTCQVLPDRLVQQDCRHRRVDTTRQCQDHLVVAQLRLQFSHSRLNERGRRPILGASANIQEIVQQLRAVNRMEHLRMELDTPRLLALYAISRVLDIVRAGHNPEILRQLGNGIPVRHPDL